ncbi:sialate O-acetylesterase [Sphingobacterium mizutaii]|uniref:sialate O-acetylesterase n=1 Tax=Sphingobacterium mizutaii TaxID=1010 RepID=UPI00162ADC7C|nr:sialate O-acetylesterase [Sphingobacterium mizutaii]
MNLKNLFLLSLLAVFAFQQNVLAQLRVPNFFSDYMVLQRGTDINFWGLAPASSEIRIVGTWFQDTVKAKTNGDGQWKTTLPAGKAGGPYEIKIMANQESITLKDILLGDVFLCSGQSNMEWGAAQNLKEIIDEMPTANNPNIRLLHISRNGALTPQDQISNKWATLSAESLQPFSAIGYFIAKEINSQEQVPIGVINSSWGGTAAEVWTPSYLIDNDPFLLQRAKQQSANDWRPHNSGVLWNAMVHPFAGYNITAAFWYQGESNVGTWDGYDKLMKTMINSWRSAWNDDFPFYFVQIAPFQYNNKEPLAAYLREQQTKTATELPNTGMVVITDLVDNIKDIHPIQKKAVAKRLADLALAEVYHKPLKDYKSPIYKSQEIKGNSIEISFSNLEGKLISKGEITDLFIAGADKQFKAAKGKIKGDKLIVESAEVKNPVAVRFGFTEIAMPNLYNSNGLPVSPFRTDQW